MIQRLNHIVHDQPKCPSIAKTKNRKILSRKECGKVSGLLQVNGDRAEHAIWCKCPQTEKERIDKVRKERAVRETLG